MPSTRHGPLLGLIALAALAGCGGGPHVRLSVTPAVSLMDAPVHLSVSGLRPHERVKARDGGRSVALIADAAGRIDLSGEASLRVLWLLDPGGTGRMTVTVLGARAAVDRLGRSPGVRVRRLRPEENGFYGDFFAPPASAAQRPGILVFGGSEGGLSTASIAALYASHGYPTLALAYFAEPGLPADLHDIPLEYFAKALHWLARQPGVDPAKLVVEGGSRGSEAAQLLGIDYPRLVHAVIAMVPGNGSSCGIERVGTQVRCIGAAWTFRGAPVPYSLRGPGTPYPFRDERIDGPVFLDCGAYDSIWPSCLMAEAIVVRLKAHHFPHRVTLLYYPRAGHGVGPLLPYAPSASLDGFSAESNLIADANGWPRLLRFLQEVADS